MARQIKTFDPTSGLDVLQLIAKLPIRLVTHSNRDGDLSSNLRPSQVLSLINSWGWVELSVTEYLGVSFGQFQFASVTCWYE